MYRSAQFRSEARMSNPENVFGIYYDTKCIFWVEAWDTFLYLQTHLMLYCGESLILFPFRKNTAFR